jgi:hypothetical protein
MFPFIITSFGVLIVLLLATWIFNADSSFDDYDDYDDFENKGE